MGVMEGSFKVQLGKDFKENPSVRAVERPYRRPDIREGLGLGIEYSLNNWLPFPVTVVTRDGVAYELPPIHRNDFADSGLVVFERVRASRSVKIDTHHVLDVPDSEASARDKTFRNLLRGAAKSNSSIVEVAMQHTVQRQTFLDAGAALYVTELDIVVYRTEAYTRILHPSSREGKVLYEQQRSGYGTAYRVTINDPWQRFGTRFMNIGGVAYHIPTISDSSRKEGVYVYHTDPFKNGHHEEIFHPLDTADNTLHLFKTEHDALTLGSIDELRKQRDEERRRANDEHTASLKAQQMELEHQYKTAQHGLEMDLLEAKNDKTRRDAEMAEMATKLKETEYRLAQESAHRDAFYADEKARRSSRMEYQKDYYEDRSYARKDSSEFFKWLPPMLVGVGLLAAKLL